MTSARQRPPFIRAAHYFGDGWPLDALLVVRRPQLRRDLRTFRRLSFDTVVIVVPWQGFQTSQVPPAYDPFYQSQLRLVLEEAERRGLAVLLRVSYVHQLMLAPTVGSVRMAEALLTEPAAREAWLDYHRTLHALATQSRSCIGMFVSWEELWHAFRYWQLRDADTRRQLAVEIGFRDYLAQQGLTEPDGIPERDSPAHRHYHRFVNARIRECFEAARCVNPLLGVEYRVDRDPVRDGGDTEWLDNDPFHDWEPARYSYWAPFMGAQNAGESLDAAQALASLDEMLACSSDQGRLLGQVIEQFNFVDDTRQYAGTHAAIADTEVLRFLEGAAPMLASRCGGYGLWAPRDYRCNVLYNAAFQAGQRGWELEKARLTRRGVRLARGGRLVQRIKPGIPWVPRMHPFEEIVLELECGRLETLLPTRLRARLNGGAWAELRRVAPGCLQAHLPVDFDTFRSRGLHFELENLGPARTISRLHLYHLTYCGGVMGPGGKPGPYGDAIRQFNRQLARLRGDASQAPGDRCTAA